MKTFIISNIKYDTTDSMGELEEALLPKNLTVECESADKIADTISDMTGWLVESYIIEDIKGL